MSDHANTNDVEMILQELEAESQKSSKLVIWLAPVFAVGAVVIGVWAWQSPDQFEEPLKWQLGSIVAVVLSIIFPIQSLKQSQRIPNCNLVALAVTNLSLLTKNGESPATLRLCTDTVDKTLRMDVTRKRVFEVQGHKYVLAYIEPQAIKKPIFPAGKDKHHEQVFAALWGTLHENAGAPTIVLAPPSRS